jgi:hypothetical protein
MASISEMVGLAQEIQRRNTPPPTMNRFAALASSGMQGLTSGVEKGEKLRKDKFEQLTKTIDMMDKVRKMEQAQKAQEEVDTAWRTETNKALGLKDPKQGINTTGSIVGAVIDNPDFRKTLKLTETGKSIEWKQVIPSEEISDADKNARVAKQASGGVLKDLPTKDLYNLWLRNNKNIAESQKFGDPAPDDMLKMNTSMKEELVRRKYLKPDGTTKQEPVSVLPAGLDEETTSRFVC